MNEIGGTGPRLSGVFPMLVTPFDTAGQIALGELDGLVDDVLRRGASGLAALGLGGESDRLEETERKSVAERVLERVAGRVPVIIGTTAQDTATAGRLAGHAAAAGAAALMVAPPSGSRLSESGLGDHYATVAQTAGDTAVMVQDAPAYIGTALSPSFAGDLARRFSNVRYIKAEGFPIIEHVSAVVESNQDARLGVFGGNGGLHYLDALEAGAVGMIPGCECVDELVAIFSAHQAGDLARATGLYRRVMPLLAFEMQSLDFYIACNKELLRRRGLLSCAALRGRPALGPRGMKALLRYATDALGPLGPE